MRDVVGLTTLTLTLRQCFLHFSTPSESFETLFFFHSTHERRLIGVEEIDRTLTNPVGVFMHEMLSAASSKRWRARRNPSPTAIVGSFTCDARRRCLAQNLWNGSTVPQACEWIAGR